MKIVDLRAAPQCLDIVADRIWRTWWAADGHSLADVAAALAEVLASDTYPFTLVALHEGRFAGTVTSIETDIQARPHLGPCLAAFWVEPEARGQGIGDRLAQALLDRLADQGRDRVYLSAKPAMRRYYQGRGWTMIESDIDRDHQDVYMRAL